MRINPFDEYGSLAAIFNVAPDSIHIRTGASDAIVPIRFHRGYNPQRGPVAITDDRPDPLPWKSSPAFFFHL